MVWGREVDRQDQLRLLALLARTQGATGLEDYVSPSEALFEQLYEDDDDEDEDSGQDTPGQRKLKIMQMAHDLGGEVA